MSPSTIGLFLPLRFTLSAPGEFPAPRVVAPPPAVAGRGLVLFRLPAGSIGDHDSPRDRLFAACDVPAPDFATDTVHLTPSARLGSGILQPDTDLTSESVAAEVQSTNRPEYSL